MYTTYSMTASIMTSILIGTISLLILSLLTITIMLWIEPANKVAASDETNGLLPFRRNLICGDRIVLLQFGLTLRKIVSNFRNRYNKQYSLL